MRTTMIDGIACYDPDGKFLALAEPGWVERAVKRGEVARSEDPRKVFLRPSAVTDLRPLTPEEKRRLYIKKHGGK